MLYFFIQGSYYLPSRKGEFPLLTITKALFTYFHMYLYFFLFGVLLNGQLPPSLHYYINLGDGCRAFRLFCRAPLIPLLSLPLY